MPHNIVPFSNADARYLREWATGLGAAGINADPAGEIDNAPAELMRYFGHYGFDRLFQRGAVCAYNLSGHYRASYHIVQHQWALENARGTVMLVHGLFDHCGLYLRLVERLLDENYNVVCFDLPGHGLSDGKRVTIDNFGQYGEVVNGCLSHCAQTLSEPFYAIGQSTGGAALMQFLLNAELSGRQLSASLDKVVLLAPLVRARSWSRLVFIHSLLQRLIKRTPRRFGANSHDRHFLHFLEHQDPLQTRYVDVPWVQAMRDWVTSFAQAPPMDTALLAVQGTADQTVDWRWNIPLIQEKFPRSKVHYVEGALHHLANEGQPWRGEIFDRLCDFLKTAP